MTPTVLRKTMAGLLIALGAARLLVGQTVATGELKLGLLLFGLAFMLLGFFLLFGKRTAVLAAMIMTALGLALDAQYYFAHGEPEALAVLSGFDFLALVIGGSWLLKTGRPGKR